MTSTALAGSTGLVGSHILATLLAHPSISSVHTYTRRDLPEYSSNPKYRQIHSTETSTWPSLYPSGTPLFLSGLGTTRAAAGGLDGQRKIDYQLNLDLARAAKAAGCTTFVLISSGSANSASMLAYVKMKSELEDAVSALGFTHTVIVRPGLIVGKRGESRPAEAVFRGLAGVMGRVSGGRLKNFWAQDADVIARAAVKAGLECVEGRREEEGVWILGGGDIIRLGKTEWEGKK
ncbi:hypothetical protein K432DRAFT_381804 [Lepidopterella palustris CBS 459.81]|uniref:NAD dependent epimerase/dehydratase family protein-like protein n=1 Tax=Lepidopterella palustris CBS 459.81 TaxID=1314670 RepID=A0A8E2JFT5_9PEZI|nr:hypothetical protein K432DRAFT_381804 [Lepidopterella palustris CBS 459.81]